jgi:hypothetical protein
MYKCQKVASLPFEIAFKHTLAVAGSHHAAKTVQIWYKRAEDQKPAKPSMAIIASNAPSSSTECPLPVSLYGTIASEFISITRTIER